MRNHLRITRRGDTAPILDVCNLSYHVLNTCHVPDAEIIIMAASWGEGGVFMCQAISTLYV